MTVHCPDCLEPVDVAPTAREGRCSWCRPQQRHSGGKPASPVRRYWTGSDTTWSEKVGTEWHMRRTFLGIPQ